MTPQFEQIVLDRLNHLADMILKHQEDGNHDSAILLSESALQLTKQLDSEDGGVWWLERLATMED